VTADDVLGALRGVIDPELGDDVVSLGMVRTVTVDPDGTPGHVAVELALTTEGCPLKVQLRKDVDARVGAVPGVTSVKTTFGVMDRTEKARLMDRARAKAQEGAPTTDIPPTCKVVAIASGKGGVGKSSVTANLAVALAQRGLTVGVLDADIWGFSIPRMLGIDDKLEVTGTKESWSMAPVELKVQPEQPGSADGTGPGLVKVVSMGFLAAEGEAIMWRGLILNRALQHFVEDVSWGQMDYLLIDLPPGTGDIQMGLARMLPRSEVIIVTTPALAAQTVAGRAADMARKGHLRVAGVIENMSAFVCEHGTSYPLFGSGGGARLASEVGVPLLAQIPMEASVARGGDTGRPVALEDGLAGQAFRELARVVVEEAVPLVEVTGCSAASILASL
jgi:ATP-binding protein involved in chromosome partitioning